MSENTDETRKQLELSNNLRVVKAALTTKMSRELHEEYLKSEDYEHHKKEGRELQAVHISRLAEARVQSDLMLACAVVVQEGLIPPKNVWREHRDLVAAITLTEGDRRMYGDMMRGYNKICVHPSEMITQTVSEFVNGLFNQAEPPVDPSKLQ